jgi:UDP:flavonoid glycosyltransferase YjiC (YdhE family)
MVVLPLFWDQHDNAQRLDETGLGIRLDPYRHEPSELRDALGRLVANEALSARLRSLSETLHNATGTGHAADLIEQAILAQ